jgi:hypothetical protein
MFANEFQGGCSGDCQEHEEQIGGEPFFVVHRRLGTGEEPEGYGKDNQRQQEVETEEAMPQRRTDGGVSGPIQNGVVGSADEQKENAGMDDQFESAPGAEEHHPGRFGIERSQADGENDAHEEDTTDGDASGGNVEPAEEDDQRRIHWELRNGEEILFGGRANVQRPTFNVQRRTVWEHVDLRLFWVYQESAICSNLNVES